jgi:hypothetical protein
MMVGLSGIQLIMLLRGGKHAEMLHERSSHEPANYIRHVVLGKLKTTKPSVLGKNSRVCHADFRLYQLTEKGVGSLSPTAPRSTSLGLGSLVVERGSGVSAL